MDTLTTQPKVWTYQDYLLLPSDQRYEILQGELNPMTPPAPDFEHQFASSRLHTKMANYIETQQSGILLAAPFDVILDEQNVVQPDLVFIAEAHRSLIQKRGLFGAPDLVVEIVSPSSLKRDLETKRKLYERFGIPEYWIVFPTEKAIEILVLNAGTYEVQNFVALTEETPDPAVQSAVLAGLTIRLVDIFT